MIQLINDAKVEMIINSLGKIKDYMPKKLSWIKLPHTISVQ